MYNAMCMGWSCEWVGAGCEARTAITACRYFVVMARVQTPAAQIAQTCPLRPWLQCASLMWAHRRVWSSLASVLKHGDQHTPPSPPDHQPAKSRFKHEKQKTSSKMTKHRWQSQPFWGHNYRIIITFWQDDRRKKFSELGVICFTWNWTIHAVRG